MAASRLKPAPLDLRSVVLTPEEGFVLSRFDGPTEPTQVAAMTGLPAARVEGILQRLVEVGALVFEPGGAPAALPSIPPPVGASRPPPSVLDPLAGLGPTAAGTAPFADSSPSSGRGGAAAAPEGSSARALALPGSTAGDGRRGLDALEAKLPEGLLPALTGASLIPRSVPSLFASTAPAPVTVDDAVGAGLPEGVTFDDDAGLPEGVTFDDDAGLPEGVTFDDDAGPAVAGCDEADGPEEWLAGEEDPAVAFAEASQEGDGSLSGPPLAPHGDHLAAYAARFRQLGVTERIALGRTAGEPELAILCLDPDPQVVAAVLSNPGCGLRHARRLALHHHNPIGLDQLSRHAALARDPQVQRNLLRNPQLSDAILQRLAARKQLSDLYKLCLDRDLPEQGRIKLRALLRSRFGNSSSEEKVELVFRTEGRVLTVLTGCTFDAKSAALMAQRTVTSLVLVQNLARFSATPPVVLAKLVQLPMVVRQPGIRQLILRHPNLPGEAKRRG